MNPAESIFSKIYIVIFRIFFGRFFRIFRVFSGFFRIFPDFRTRPRTRTPDFLARISDFWTPGSGPPKNAKKPRKSRFWPKFCRFLKIACKSPLNALRKWPSTVLERKSTFLVEISTPPGIRVLGPIFDPKIGIFGSGSEFSDFRTPTLPSPES